MRVASAGSLVLVAVAVACGGSAFESTGKTGSGGSGASSGSSGSGGKSGSGTGGSSTTGGSGGSIGGSGGSIGGSGGSIGGSGGSIGSGGSSGKSGSGGVGGTGGVTGGCVPGGPCSPDGATCSSGGCCPCQYTCQNGSWQMGACAPCVAPICPPSVPTSGNACDCSAPVGVPCDYNQCPTSHMIATCDGQTWNVSVAPCTTGGCCSTDTDCGLNAICAKTVCEPRVAGACWRDADCNGSQCAGAFICGCTADCGYLDYPGACIPSGSACCLTDVNCPTGEECVKGVCKLPVMGGCWTNKDCNGLSCHNASVCACGMQCLVGDSPGTCG